MNVRFKKLFGQPTTLERGREGGREGERERERVLERDKGRKSKGKTKQQYIVVTIYTQYTLYNEAPPEPPSKQIGWALQSDPHYAYL